MVRSWNARRANQRFGYLDGSQRPAWYQTVTTRENLLGLRLQTDDHASTPLLLHYRLLLGPQQWVSQTSTYSQPPVVRHRLKNPSRPQCIY